MRYVNAPNTAFGEDRRSYKTGTNGVTSNQTVFNVSYDNGRVEAYLNGVRLYPGDDFTKSSSGIGTSITLASAIGANNVLEVVGYQGINSGNALIEDNFVVGTNSTGSGGSYSGSTTVFPVASSAGDTVSVWRNGVKLVPTTDYTVDASASTVTLPTNQAASVGDEITVQVVGGVIHNNGLTVNGGSNSFSLPTTRGADTYVLTRDDTVGTGGTTWKETISAPAITNVTGEINEDTDTTLTVTGSGFASGMTLKLINASTNAEITGHTLLSYSGSSSPLTVTIPSATTNITAGTQVKLVIDKQGLTTQSSAITVSGDPDWTTASGIFATIADTLNASGGGQTVGTLIASASQYGSGTVIYSSDSSDHGADALDSTYFSLDGATGVITTTSTALTALTSAGNFTESFKANAKISGQETIKNTLLSGINIIVSATIPVEYLVVGGGGGSGEIGGGGGAGGVRVGDIRLSQSTALQLTVGTGGSGAHASGMTNGGNSTFSSIVATGGGHGGSYFVASGTGGGSGGGGGRSKSGTTGINGSGSFGSLTFQGYNGGNGGFGGSGGEGGGGGGAGDHGTSSSANNPGDGGIGYTSSLLNAIQHGESDGNGNYYIAGGGGGGGYQHTGGNGQGGLGGGGNGSGSGGGSNGSSGTNYYGAGGGGGAGAGGSGGSGGHGVIILKIPNSVTATFSSGVTKYEDLSAISGYKVYKITSANSSQTVTFTF